jgi:hypothetical protein
MTDGNLKTWEILRESTSIPNNGPLTGLEVSEQYLTILRAVYLFFELSVSITITERQGVDIHLIQFEQTW